MFSALLVHSVEFGIWNSVTRQIEVKFRKPVNTKCIIYNQHDFSSPEWYNVALDELNVQAASRQAIKGLY